MDFVPREGNNVAPFFYFDTFSTYNDYNVMPIEVCLSVPDTGKVDCKQITYTIAGMQ